MKASAIPSLCVLPCPHDFCKLRTKFSLVNISWIIFPVTTINPYLIPMVTTNKLKEKNFSQHSIIHMSCTASCLIRRVFYSSVFWSLFNSRSNSGRIPCDTACPVLSSIYQSLHSTVHMVGLCAPGPQGRFATSPQGPAKKLKIFDCTKTCVINAKL